MSETDLTPLEAFLADTSVDLGWSLVQRYSVLVRESGTPDERDAANFVITQLREREIRVEVHQPDLYLSVPVSASVSAAGAEFEAKAPSFSASTTARGLARKPVFVSAKPAEETDDILEDDNADPPPDVKDKIVVTEGYPTPVSVAKYEAAGAAGQIYINPGTRIHWGTCTTIWGSPGDSQRDQRPKTPVAAISRLDGNKLVAAIEDGLDKVNVRTELREGWSQCLVPVARIDGKTDEFVLAHGHYDSWDVGIGDNAVGDATLLELARIFHEKRDRMRRSLRVAWWPAHSTGRYAGSAWYADAFAHELSRLCVATVNIDSPGCWQATEYDEVPWMAEAGSVCREAIKSVAGVEPQGRRPPRAGDYSFNQLGLTSFFMLLSNIPAEERARLGFYPVGGCGGNIVWHTEKDRLDVADRTNLERDLRVYVTAVGRFLADEVLPLDFRKTAEELGETLAGYEPKVDKKVLSLLPLRKEFEKFRTQLNTFYERVAAGSIKPSVANEAIMELSRALVHLGYAEGGRFEHDSATPKVPIPKLARIHELAQAEESEPERVPFIYTELRRQLNKVFDLLYRASQAVARANKQAT